MRMNIRHQGKACFLASCRGHEIRIDQPKDNGGDDTGMTPPELMAAALASCIGFYVARYCEQAGLNSEGLEVDCDWQVGGDPRRMQSFDIVVHAPKVPARRQAALQRVAHHCLIQATLDAGSNVRLNVQTEEA